MNFNQMRVILHLRGGRDDSGVGGGKYFIPIPIYSKYVKTKIFLSFLFEKCFFRGCPQKLVLFIFHDTLILIALPFQIHSILLICSLLLFYYFPSCQKCGASEQVFWGYRWNITKPHNSSLYSTQNACLPVRTISQLFLYLTIYTMYVGMKMKVRSFCPKREAWENRIRHKRCTSQEIS